MNNYKIKVNNEAEFNEICNLSSELGYPVPFSYSNASEESVKAIYLKNGQVEWAHRESHFDYEEAEILTITQLRDLVLQEQGLISGADALRALADGEDVQWISKDFPKWDDLDTWNANTRNFLDEKCIIEGGFKYRIKPRTVKLEIEIPAPFEPKEFEDCYMLTDLYEHGYTKTSWKYKSVPAWRTEEEIKKVVAALRGIKG